MPELSVSCMYIYAYRIRICSCSCTISIFKIFEIALELPLGFAVNVKDDRKSENHQESIIKLNNHG